MSRPPPTRRKIEAQQNGQPTVPGVRASGTQLSRARAPDGEGAEPPDLGPRATLEEIYDAYCVFVFVRLRRAGVHRKDAKDLHQDVFLHLAELLAKGTRPENVASLLARLVLIALLNRARAGRRFPSPDDGTLTELLADSRRNPERDVYADEQRRILDEAIARLPERQAQLIQWLDIAEMDPGAVAEALGCTLPTLRVQLHRARSALYEIAATLAGEDLEGDS